MRKTIISVAATALIVGLCACSSPGPQTQTQAGDAEGVSGATIKRAAVLGNHVDFGSDVNSVENYDLQTQRASVANPIDSSDVARDDEIDAIVNKISNDNGAPVLAPPRSAKPPAVPPLRQSGRDASDGVTGSVEQASAATPLPPVPSGVSNPVAGEDAQMAADQARLFPKPLWRRELEEKSQAPVPAPQPVNGK